MPYLTDLARVCRDAGLKVEEVDGWRSRGHASFSSVEAVVCHHTAGPTSGNMPSLNVVTHGRAGLSGPLCQLGLGRDGTVYVVAAGVAWHAGETRQSWQGNYRSIGIEAEATGVTTWPKVQMDAYAQLCKALCDHYDIPVNRVLGHKEVCSPPGRKIDPNFSMDTFRRSVRNATEEEDMTPQQAKQLEAAHENIAWLRKRMTAFMKNEVKRDRWRNKQIQWVNKQLKAVRGQVADDATKAQVDQIEAALDALAEDVAELDEAGS